MYLFSATLRSRLVIGLVYVKITPDGDLSKDWLFLTLKSNLISADEAIYREGLAMLYPRCQKCWKHQSDR